MSNLGYRWWVFFAFLMNFQSAWAESFYSKIKACPRGTIAQVRTIAEVDPELLPAFALNQGDSPTCSIHAGIVLANSIYQLNKLKSGIKTKDQLSVLDGMFRFGKVSSDDATDCSLPFIESMASFLIKLRNNPRLKIDTTSLTVEKALQSNDTLLEQIDQCQKNRCSYRKSRITEPHSPCLERVCQAKPIKDLSQGISDWKKLHQELDPDYPVLTLLENSNRLEVDVPPFQIKTWDRFESEDELQNTLIQAFTEQKPTLPIGLASLFDSEDDVGHAVALTRLEQINCVDERGKTQQSHYRATLINSWGRSAHGPIDLKPLVSGMLKWGQGFVQILPCNPESAQCTPIAIEHSRSAVLAHYSEANDSSSIKDLLMQDSTDPNQASPTGLTALHYAALHGHVEVIRTLLSHPRINPNLREGEVGAPALYLAAQEGHLDCVKALIDHSNTDPNLPWQGRTPLYIAAIFENEDVVRELLRSPRVNRERPKDYYKWMKREEPKLQANYLTAERLIERLITEVDGGKAQPKPSKKRKRGDD